jgi:hypothetical protein|tara:strand:- start:12 stop:533 length:522 start_codon:yes stop_codon:yes gene_type:complete
MALITLEGYKDYKDLKTPNNDQKLEPLVAFVNTFVENYCSLSFEEVTVVGAKATSDNELEVLVPHPALNAVTRVSVSGVDLDPTKYYVDLAVGTIEAVDSFPTTRNAIEIDYTYGYTTPPADLVISAYELVSYFNKGSFSTKITSSTGESSSSPTPTLVPPQIKLMLDLYKVL